MSGNVGGSILQNYTVGLLNTLDSAVRIVRRVWQDFTSTQFQQLMQELETNQWTPPQLHVFNQL